jgi:hypothetical protein
MTLFLKDLRIYRAVREFDGVLGNPSAAIEEVWIAGRFVTLTINRAGMPRRWQRQFHRASRIVSDIKRRSGNRILLWVMFPGVD